MTDRTSDTGPRARDPLREALEAWRGQPAFEGQNGYTSTIMAAERMAVAIEALLDAPAPDPAPLREALGKLPPGPYTVSWPDHQGGLFSLWGRQGTPPDFTDGWAIPLVASGVDTAINALADLLNALAARPAREKDGAAEDAMAADRAAAKAARPAPSSVEGGSDAD